jgi:hypothetical protein
MQSAGPRRGSGYLPAGVVELNVGGSIFQSSRETLLQSPFFEAALTDGSEQLFLDRSPGSFALVLDYLRSRRFPTVSATQLVAFLEEAAYFQLPFRPSCVVHVRFTLHLPLLNKDPRGLFLKFAQDRQCGGEVRWTNKELLEGTITVPVSSATNARDILEFLDTKNAAVTAIAFGNENSLEFSLPATSKKLKTSRSPDRGPQAGSSDVSSLPSISGNLPYATLTHEQVIAWLAVTELSNYVEAFEQNSIDGAHLAELLDSNNPLFDAVWETGADTQTFARLLRFLSREVQEGMFSDDVDIVIRGALLSFGPGSQQEKEEKEEKEGKEGEQ